MTSAPVLRLDDVSFRRESTQILRDVTWSVHAGEHWVILGRNGSGKSTLAQVASMYEHPSSGIVEVLASGEDEAVGPEQVDEALGLPWK